MTGQAADAIARESLASRGLDKFFTHSLGHGTASTSTRRPPSGPNSKDVLQDNMVFSIEPGVYFEGKFGIRTRRQRHAVRRRSARLYSDKKLTML